MFATSHGIIQQLIGFILLGKPTGVRDSVWGIKPNAKRVGIISLWIKWPFLAVDFSCSLSPSVTNWRFSTICSFPGHNFSYAFGIYWWHPLTMCENSHTVKKHASHYQVSVPFFIVKVEIGLPTIVFGRCLGSRQKYLFHLRRLQIFKGIELLHA